MSQRGEPVPEWVPFEKNIERDDPFLPHQPRGFSTIAHFQNCRTPSRSIQNGVWLTEQRKYRPVSIRWIRSGNVSLLLLIRQVIFFFCLHCFWWKREYQGTQHRFSITCHTLCLLTGTHETLEGIESTRCRNVEKDATAANYQAQCLLYFMKTKTRAGFHNQAKGLLSCKRTNAAGVHKCAQGFVCLEEQRYALSQR